MRSCVDLARCAPLLKWMDGLTSGPDLVGGIFADFIVVIVPTFQKAIPFFLPASKMKLRA
jgi:hypothetical protein